jgi:putative glutamine amidotransferase
MLIAISKGIGHWKYERYATWLAQRDREVETIELSSLSDQLATKAIQKADGIVLTGGSDIDPDRYGHPEFKDLYECKVDLERDDREFRWFAAVQELNIPILGICRGMQLINVTWGGTLIPDIPSVIQRFVKHCLSDTEDAFHSITLQEGTVLSDLQNSVNGYVNSSHHQSIDLLGRGLRTIARAEDGVIEAIERRSPHDGNFLLGVQWHPERMDITDPLSGGVADLFLEHCRK